MIEIPEYPAILTVHWPGKSINCCVEHATKLMIVATASGFKVTSTLAPENKQCTNCINENER